MFFSSIKEMNGLLTEINRLSKGMSNIYLKVTIEKKWRTQNFDFQSLKNSSPGQFWGTFNSRRYRIFWEQNCVAFLLFLFWKKLWRFKVKKCCWTKIQTLIKTRRNRKWKIPHTVLERWTQVLQLVDELRITSKSVMNGARERKLHFFCNVYFVRRKFFHICVLRQNIVYCINFQKIYTFPYQKTLLQKLLLLVY